MPGCSVLSVAALLLVLEPWPLTAVLLHQNPATDVASVLAGCDGIDCVDRYVKVPDSSYSWCDTGERINGTNMDNGVNWTGYVLNMTSQTWRPESEVEFPVWWHTLVVIVPSNLEFPDWSTMSLDFGINFPFSLLLRIDNRASEDPEEDFIQAGTWIDHENLRDRLGLLKLASEKAAYYATKTRAIATCVLNIQNAYETFGNDWLQKRRNGESLKAYTYADFVNYGAMDPARVEDLPMTKAVIRAMDTVTSFTATLPSGKVQRFGVAGYSKLGTVVWLSGALDERVKVIVPGAIHMDLYNMLGSLRPKDKSRPHLRLYDFFMNLTSNTTPNTLPFSPHKEIAELSKLGIFSNIHPRKRNRKNGIFSRFHPNNKSRSGLKNPFGKKNPYAEWTSWMLATSDYRVWLMAMEYQPLFAVMGTPLFERLHRLLDPAAYPEKLKIPVYYIMASNDQLFTSSIDEIADSLPKLKGHTSFYEVPNCMHEETLVESIQSSAAFIQSVIANVKPIPEIAATFDARTGTISFRQASPHVPIKITQWSGLATMSRDFQYTKWAPVALSYDSNNTGTAFVMEPDDGTFAGSFVEFHYAWPSPEHVFKITTPVWVLPK